MKYTIIGMDRDTAEPIEMTLEALNEHDAREKAGQRNMLVQHVAAATPPPAGPDPAHASAEGFSSLHVAWGIMAVVVLLVFGVIAMQTGAQAVGVAFFVVAILGVLVALAELPPRQAARNGHPQVDAIRVCSWLGLLFTGGLLWVAAVVWASVKPHEPHR